MAFIANSRNHSSNDRPARETMDARFILVWASLGEWARNALERLLATEWNNDDPTTLLSPREWADLPTHHPKSPEDA